MRSDIGKQTSKHHLGSHLHGPAMDLQLSLKAPFCPTPELRKSATAGLTAVAAVSKLAIHLALQLKNLFVQIADDLFVL